MSFKEIDQPTHFICFTLMETHLGIYRTRSATTNPTLKKRLLAGMNGNTRNSTPTSTSLLSCGGMTIKKQTYELLEITCYVLVKEKLEKKKEVTGIKDMTTSIQTSTGAEYECTVMHNICNM